MRNTLLVYFTLFFALCLSAQEVVSTSGDSYTKPSGSIDFTVGEPVINTGSNGGNEITQGFHQTYWQITKLEDLAPNFEATFFPNPTADFLHIKTSEFSGVTYHLIDGNGKVVLQSQLTADKTTLQVKDLSAGSYSLVLKKSTKNLKTFKLIKLK